MANSVSTSYLGNMAIWVQNILNVRQGEGKKAALMFFYPFLLISTLLMVKPVRTSLFLTELGVSALPYAYILVAVSSAILITVYSRLAEHHRLHKMIYTTLGLSIASLLVFWLLLTIDYRAQWLYYLFWAWVAIFGPVVVSQFWLLANYVFDAREAKRLFSLLGAGAISGGIVGGSFTSLMTPLIGTNQMLLCGAVFLTISVVLVKLIWNQETRERYSDQLKRRKKYKFASEEKPTLALIFESQHLTYWMLLVAISVIVANLVDYQYNAIASSVITDADELTAFFGLWTSILNFASLLIQVFLTSKFIKKFGVSASLFFLPVGIIIGAICVLGTGALWAAVLMRSSEGSIKQSINKASLELLALPVPAEIKNRVKAFIDIFIDNLSTGLVGLMLIGMTYFLKWNVQQIGYVILGLLGVWLFLNVQMRKAYVLAFRQAIEKRTIHLKDETARLDDASLLNSLLTLLEGENVRQILYVLSIMENTQSERLAPYLDRLLDNDNEEVLIHTLRLAYQQKNMDLQEKVWPLIKHDNQLVRIESVRYILLSAEDSRALFQDFIKDEDIRIRLAALMVAALEYNSLKDTDGVEVFREFFTRLNDEIQNLDADQDEIEFYKKEFACILGAAKDPELYPYLHLLLGDTSLNTLRHAIRAAGNTRSEEFIPTLIAHLSTRRVRGVAQEALASYGETILPHLLPRMDDPHEDIRIRVAVPEIMYRISSQEVVTVLENYLAIPDVIVRDSVIRALSKIKSRYKSLKCNKQIVATRIREEARHYCHMLLVYHTQLNVLKRSRKTNDENSALNLLVRAIEERLAKTLEWTFRLLSMTYSPDDMYNAYTGVIHEKADLRANAVEFLDNVLEHDLKRVILPLAEHRTSRVLVKHAREMYGLQSPTEEESLEYLVNTTDGWLRACTLFRLAEIADPDYELFAEKHLNDQFPVVRETAQLVMRKLNRSEQSE